MQLSAIGCKDLRQLARKAIDAGWSVELTRSNHVRWVSPNAEINFISSLTPRGNTAYHRAKSMLRRGGLDAGR